MELIPYRRSNNPTSHCNLPTSRYSLPYPFQLGPPPATHKQPALARSTSASLTNISRGAQKRADGTILENDYPGFYNTGKKNRLLGGYSLSHLNRLEVNFAEELEADCQVDQDGVTNDRDYMFSRKAPERRLVRNTRREHRSSTPTTPSSRRTSDIAVSMSRHSSAEVFYRHSVPGTTEGTDPGLANLMLKNFRTKRHTVLA